jgi:hypothetical protein
LRVHHAVMDGLGGLALAQDLFRILRGERALGSNSTASELDVWRAANFGQRRVPTAPPNAIAPFQPRDGDPDAPSVWKRTIVPGRLPWVIPKVALAVADQCRRIREGPVRIALFVNLRRHLAPSEITLANCTSMIMFDVEPGDTLRDLTNRIVGKMNRREYLDMTPYVNAVRWIPAGVFQPGVRAVRRQYRSGLARASAFVTHVGTYSPEMYSYDAFQTTRLLPIPPSDPTTPLHLVIGESPKEVEIVANAPKAFGGDGRLDALVDGIVARLTEDAVAIAG